MAKPIKREVLASTQYHLLAKYGNPNHPIVVTRVLANAKVSGGSEPSAPLPGSETEL